AQRPALGDAVQRDLVAGADIAGELQRLAGDLDPAAGRERHQRDRDVVVRVQPERGCVVQRDEHRTLPVDDSGTRKEKSIPAVLRIAYCVLTYAIRNTQYGTGKLYHGAGANMLEYL